MKKIILATLLFWGNNTFAQNNKLLQHKLYFEKELRAWKQTFSNFNLADFKATDTTNFLNNNDKSLKFYKEFMTIYKPIITFSSDSTKFIDIYSYQLNLEKKGNRFIANTDIDQAIFLFDKNKKYWKSIYFMGTTNGWIEDIVWISKTEFLLVGIEKNDVEKKLPKIILGNTEKQRLYYFNSSKNNMIQLVKYKSSSLKKMKIIGI
jgi:hypothetical protein